MTGGLNRALFLDRDGVINVERGYVHRRETFEFTPGIFELCRAAQSLDYLLVVVTNQAGIARGYYSELDFNALTQWMTDQFAERMVRIAGIYYCPYHPIFGVGKYKRDSLDRKPKPGMLLRAQSDLNLDLGSSVLIGDKPSDVEAGRAAGVGTRILYSVQSATSDALDELKTQCYISSSLDDIRSRFFSDGNPFIQKHEAEEFTNPGLDSSRR
jgi:D-glycero-D-manno-heptose 1,7-bisphosphate phosphatase